MARSRNIKPGFFLNEDLVELSFSTRLLFIGLWCLADRKGRLENRHKKIKMQLFPADDLDMPEALLGLYEAGLINMYTVDSINYIQVNNFDKHQNPHHKEAESIIPSPDLIDKPEAFPSVTVLIPDSLIPDSLIPDSGLPEKPIKPAPAKKKKQQEIITVEYLDGLNKEAWLMWIDHRKEAKIKKLTPRGENIAIKQLIAMGNHAEQKQIIEYSMANGYTGLFPLKKKSQGQQAEKGNIMDWVHGEKPQEKVINGETYESE